MNAGETKMDWSKKYNTINGWTKQKMINHIKKNFNGKSVNNEGSCQYRGPNETKCAVGMFIPDKKYKTTMESITGSVVIARFKLKMPLELNGMDALQLMHDTSHPMDTLEDMLSWIDNCVED